MNSSAAPKPFWKKPMGIALIIIATIAILAIIGNQLPDVDDTTTEPDGAHASEIYDDYKDITSEAQAVDDRITDAYTFTSIDGTTPIHASTNADSLDYETGTDVCEALIAAYPDPKIIVYDKDDHIIAERAAGQPCE